MISTLMISTLSSGHTIFNVNGVAGSGGYAKVFSAVKIRTGSVKTEAVALKVGC